MLGDCWAVPKVEQKVIDSLVSFSLISAFCSFLRLKKSWEAVFSRWKDSIISFLRQLLGRFRPWQQHLLPVDFIPLVPGDTPLVFGLPVDNGFCTWRTCRLENERLSTKKHNRFLSLCPGIRSWGAFGRAAIKRRFYRSLSGWWATFGERSVLAYETQDEYQH